MTESGLNSRIRLQRYFGFHAYDTLLKQRLKLVSPIDFNDPFEFQYQYVGKMTRERAIAFIQSRRESESMFEMVRSQDPSIRSISDYQKIFTEKNEDLIHRIMTNYNIENFDSEQRLALDEIDRAFRIACFSSCDVQKGDEILMWSHYADKHRGVRITFEMPRAKSDSYIVYDVDYDDSRIPLDITDHDSHQQVLETFESLLRRKAKCWSYERECRLVAKLDQCLSESENNKILHFLTFDKLCVRQIDLGLNSPSSEDDRIVQVARKEYPHAEIRKARRHRTDFSLEYIQI